MLKYDAEKKELDSKLDECLKEYKRYALEVVYYVSRQNDYIMENYDFMTREEQEEARETVFNNYKKVKEMNIHAKVMED